MTEDEVRRVLVSLAGVYDGDEPVDELSHAVQCALHAQDAGSEVELIAAALFHDVARSPLIRTLQPNLPHETAGAIWLKPRFGERVAWVVGAHAAAKVYLMDNEPGYRELLSAESKRSAETQRGVVLSDFVTHRWWGDALQLRRWDDVSKDPSFELPDMRDLLTLVEGVRIG
jgi:predicted HD phosphohydrolase